jgi:hypothetical protein
MLVEFCIKISKDALTDQLEICGTKKLVQDLVNLEKPNEEMIFNLFLQIDICSIQRKDD